MKVGAGGLQSQVMFELDPVRREGMLRGEHQVRADAVPELGRNIPEGERLVRLVEQLNAAAALANHPFRFRTERTHDRWRIYRYFPEEAEEREEEISPAELAEIRRQLDLEREGLLDKSV
uniref:Uncharacterized protein n=1 Tax=Ammonifex degensii TaxID=42838 RepID=A0A7C2IFM1_9THEO